MKALPTKLVSAYPNSEVFAVNSTDRDKLLKMEEKARGNPGFRSAGYIGERITAHLSESQLVFVDVYRPSPAYSWLIGEGE